MNFFCTINEISFFCYFFSNFLNPAYEQTQKERDLKSTHSVLGISEFFPFSLRNKQLMKNLRERAHSNISSQSPSQPLNAVSSWLTVTPTYVPALHPMVLPLLGIPPSLNLKYEGPSCWVTGSPSSLSHSCPPSLLIRTSKAVLPQKCAWESPGILFPRLHPGHLSSALISSSYALYRL